MDYTDDSERLWQQLNQAERDQRHRDNLAILTARHGASPAKIVETLREGGHWQTRNLTTGKEFPRLPTFRDLGLDRREVKRLTDQELVDLAVRKPVGQRL